MKKQTIFPLLAVFVSSLACQTLIPTSRAGTVISDCPGIVSAVSGVQPGAAPQALLEIGVKQGDEFDANDYFNALTHISMEEGYTLDYVYQVDSLGAYPMMYARPVDQPAYASTRDLPVGFDYSDYLSHVSIENTELGYFEFVAMNIMAGQFYLDWHANYNDTQIVCNKDDVTAIMENINDGSFGIPFDLSQQVKTRSMRDIEPLVTLTEDTASVEIITFTKWGGFYRRTYTIDRSFPHEITDVQTENLVPYDCGIAF